MAALSDYICDIVEECIENNLSKDETMRHLWDKYLIPHEYTNIVWNHLERANPDLFISYYARIHERNPQQSFLTIELKQSLSSFFALFQFCVIFEECIENNMSKAEILSYVNDKYLIPLHDTNRGLSHFGFRGTSFQIESVFFPILARNMDPFNPYRAVGNKVKECIDKYLMSKEETERYLEDQQGITRQDTNMAWIILERMHPDLFTSYYARIHERNARTRERVSSTSPRERASAILGGQEQQRLSPARRSLLPDSNVPDASPQEANAVYPTSQAGTSIASNALGHIIKLLSDGHGLGPHPSATGSLKRKQVSGENEERGENEEGEKLKENERDGNNEEAEKQVMEKEECNDEEAEKPKEKEEGSDEKLQKNEEGDNEGLQKKNEGDNEELQEAA
ncbi:unnamed protein product [Brassica rapa subsp. trilocularis]